MTFSIVARSSDSKLFGVAIASSSPAVAARCAHARAGCGAVASQNITDPALGSRVLDGLGVGGPASAAIAAALQTTRFGAYRQLLAIGREGPAAIHSGDHALGLVGTAIGEDSAAAGNLLASTEVPAAGGEAGPIHSAGLLVVRDVSWPIVDLRVDWADENPLAVLDRLWEIYCPQIEAYVRRALAPEEAPSFGVPGDL